MNIPLKKLALFIPVIVVVIIFVFLSQKKSQEFSIADVSAGDNLVQSTAGSDPQQKDQTTGTAIVDIKGAVKNPGVYEIDINARVNDVIDLAGGFKKDADESQINLAQKVQDEMIILVPNKQTVSGQTSNTAQGTNTTEAKLRLNQATQQEIEQLNGIGPSKAKAILEYRDEIGMFHTVEELLEVPGIGEKTLENIKDDIQVP
ncbi:helix-hairpin-helix domain-containing protein [Virgibacillus sp. 179-BFC.A HS]|uniref:Helix-hairpin-helix domain-containing protein n=1 Tax=Tigheibacillus jepli TaxID=3035914 RepID=A0ABU5CGQ4_9BACI|nr:helix-hairpin-helix domain-containing protein [Virgibacillus sp. 179-BFC.A HS]MDY0405514.1 helix-hairpin-helix domain-containing protein [Virgibacillus sp. 179-BFC.A HS]